MCCRRLTPAFAAPPTPRARRPARHYDDSTPRHTIVTPRAARTAASTRWNQISGIRASARLPSTVPTITPAIDSAIDGHIAAMTGESALLMGLLSLMVRSDD